MPPTAWARGSGEPVDEVFEAPTECQRPGCSLVPIVGIGGPAGAIVWVCEAHLGEALEKVSAVIDRAVRHALSARWN